MSTIHWTQIDLGDRSRWDRTVDRIPHSFSHTWDHCRAHARDDEKMVLVHAEWSTGEAICPLRLRQGRLGIDVATPYGFSGFCGRGDLSALPDRWQAYATSQHWISGYLVVNPWLDQPSWQREHGLRAGNSLFALNLAEGEAALADRLSRTRRRQLRKWQTDAYRLVTEKPLLLAFARDNAEDFYRLVGHDYGLSAEAWAVLFSSDRTLALGVESTTGIVAMTLFGIGTHVADAMFNIATPDGRDAATFLMWTGAKRLIDRGLRTLNMGGGSSPTDAVAESKRRFGGTEVGFAALRQVYDQTRFEAECRLSGCGTSIETGYFPPYRARPGA